MAKKHNSVHLSDLQSNAEAAARHLKSARTTLATAKLNVERAEKAHAVAQDTFQHAVDQVKASTKVL